MRNRLHFLLRGRRLPIGIWEWSEPGGGSQRICSAGRWARRRMRYYFPSPRAPRNPVGCLRGDQKVCPGARGPRA
eukprot:4535896-Pyramimonas_sp.AAC.1